MADEPDSPTAAAKAVFSRLAISNHTHLLSTPTPSESPREVDGDKAEIQRYYDELQGGNEESSDVATGSSSSIPENSDLHIVGGGSDQVLTRGSIYNGPQTQRNDDIASGNDEAPWRVSSIAAMKLPRGLLEFTAKTRVFNWVHSLSAGYDTTEPASHSVLSKSSCQRDGIQSTDAEAMLAADCNAELYSALIPCVQICCILKPSNTL